MLQPARPSALGDEFIHPEQVLGPVPTFPLDRVTRRSIVSHRMLRGFSGTVSVQQLTSWNGLENTSWETEQDLEQYGNVVERYIGRVSRSKSVGKTRNIERIVCRWQNGRKRGQPAMYTHLTSLAHTFLQDTWRWMAICQGSRTSGGCGERDVSSHHQDARLGEAV